MKYKLFIFFVLFIFKIFHSQTSITVVNYPVNTSHNPTLTTFDFITGDSKSYWNKKTKEVFIISTNDNKFTNFIIREEEGESKSFFIRKNDSIVFDYNTREIISSGYGYKKDDFRLTTISNDDNWKKRMGQEWQVSEDFYEIIELQNKLSKMSYLDIPSDFPRGIPMFRFKLYQYLDKNYPIKNKVSKKKNVYKDYLDYFERIYKDPSLDRKNLSQFVFTSLNTMSYATTKEDFMKAYALFKMNTNDINAVEHIENDFFLENKLIDRKIIGIINQNRKPVKLENLIRKNKGRYILIDFWASWCIPCLTSVPKVKKITEKYKDVASVIYLSLDRNFSSWKNAQKKFDISEKDSYLIVNGMQKDLIISSKKITSLPRYFLYDRNGVLIESENIENIEKRLKQLTNGEKIQ